LKHIISVGIKELFMLVTALCMACFSLVKVNKKLWPLYFKIWPPTLIALVPALLKQVT